MKIPPRSMFWCQVIASMVAGTVQLGVMNWMFTNIPHLCEVQQLELSGFTCASTQVFATASVVWGLIGPALQFSKGQLYYRMSFPPTEKQSIPTKSMFRH
ncbi:hypothetical protein QCA50_007276 [Cerrena zonata]|uniref:Uncharacterized protein n=1 Tax=Cerrena zonata TaxID=2478898 RepID=A0AAW0GIB1_9APHY